MDHEKTKPVYSDELGALQYAVWENQTANGKCYLNVELTRNFQDKDGWHTEKLRLRDSHVVLLAHLLRRCIRDLDAHATDDSAKSTPSSTA